MSQEETQLKAKRILGLLLLATLLVINSRLFFQNQQLAVFLFTGVLFGYVLTRSTLGFSSKYVEFFNTGRSKTLIALLSLLAISIIGTALIHSYFASNGAVPAFRAGQSQQTIPGTSAVSSVDLSMIAGAFLFGAAMVVNKGCGSGTLRNLGNGSTRYIVTVLFLLIGTIPGQIVSQSFSQSSLGQYSIQMYLPETFGYVGTVVVSLVILGILAYAAKVYELKRKEAKTYQPEENDSRKRAGMYQTLFCAKWPPLIGAVGISLLLFFSLLTTGDTLKVTAPYVKSAVSFFSLLGISFESPAFQSVHSDLQNGLWRDPETLRNGGIFLGALVYHLTNGSFTFSWSVPVKETGLYAVSGFLMGFGAMLASGCNVGALYSGIANLSLSGWVVLLFLGLGAVWTMNLLNHKVTTINQYT